MVIDFVYSIADLQHEASDLKIRAIQELARSHRLGYHVVVMRRDIATWIVENCHLSSQDSSIVARIGRDYTQSADLVRRSHFVVRVAKIAQNFPIKNGKYIDMNLGCASRPHMLDRVAIVVEDAENDKNLYDMIFQLVKGKVGTPILSWEAYHGGGSRTVDVTKQKIDERRIVCTILDTDKLAPSETIIEKQTLLTDYADTNRWPLLFVLTARCREIENIIPFSIVKQLPCSSNHKSLHLIERIISLEEKSGVALEDRFWLYFDIKEGIDINKTRELKDEFARSWLEKKVACVAWSKDLTKIDGFGKNVASQLSSTSTVKSDLRKSVLSEDWWQVFGDHIANIMWLCAATQRSFV